MVATHTRACLLVAAAVTVAGCARPASQPPGPVAPAQSSGPTIRKLPEAAALLEELIGVDAFVYEFSGSFLEVWLEGEVENVGTKETEKFRSSFPTAISRDDFKDRTGSIAGKVRGKIVVWGEERSALSLRISAEVPREKPAAGTGSPDAIATSSTTLYSLRRAGSASPGWMRMPPRDSATWPPPARSWTSLAQLARAMKTTVPAALPTRRSRLAWNQEASGVASAVPPWPTV